jgi:hypothetical protein
MSDSKPSKPASPRPTLKLKTSPRKLPQVNVQPAAQPQSKLAQKPNTAAWSDEFKRQMQQDMDALVRR